MAHHIFQSESELQNIPEAAPEASRSFSVSEKLARYGSSALSGVEHLTLLVGRKSVARLRVTVKKVLRKYGYPPDKQKKAIQTVLRQAELLCADWAM